MVISEPHTLVMEAVNIGGLQYRVAVARQIAITLVIGQDEDDVRWIFAQSLEVNVVGSKGRKSKRACRIMNCTLQGC